MLTATPVCVEDFFLGGGEGWGYFSIYRVEVDKGELTVILTM